MVSLLCGLRSGRAPSARAAPNFITLFDFLRAGDTLVATRVDRLARSIGDLQDIVRELKTKGVTLRATEQPIDTSTAAGKAFLDMLGVFAEFETNLRRERQMEGIAKAKAAGVYAGKGRKPSVDVETVRRLVSEGKSPTDIARALKIGRASVHRAIGLNALVYADRTSTNSPTFRAGAKKWDAPGRKNQRFQPEQKEMEASPGIEPGCKDLQSSA